MIKAIKLLTFGIVLMCLHSSIAFSQPGSNWQPIFLTVTGHNMIEGVEAFFQAGKCEKGESVVFIKFINHNAQSVQLEWYDGVFTQELNWINKEGDDNKKSLIISGNKEANGHCSSLEKDLVIKLSDFIKDPNNFKRYAASYLQVTLIQN